MKLEGLVNKAFEFAQKAHEDQIRKTGEPYITHPEAVVDIVREYGADNVTICACYLHDVVEDTKVSLDELREIFGNTVAYLVDGVTKVEGDRKATIEKIRKYSEWDKRVILIKMSDRIHNLRRAVDPKDKDRIFVDMEKYNISTEAYIEIGRKHGYYKLADELEQTLMSLNEILVAK